MKRDKIWYNKGDTVTGRGSCTDKARIAVIHTINVCKYVKGCCYIHTMVVPIKEHWPLIPKWLCKKTTIWALFAPYRIYDWNHFISRVFLTPLEIIYTCLFRVWLPLLAKINLCKKSMGLLSILLWIQEDSHIIFWLLCACLLGWFFTNFGIAIGKGGSQFT